MIQEGDNHQNHSKDSSVPIDAVIAWVDGDDPAHQRKMKPYLDSKDQGSFGTKATRFGSVNEIRYCLLSIYTFAPFIRNVYVVTDNQDPMLYDDIKSHSPHRLNSFRIVDHKEIFKGFEQYLPVFNSRAIETMLWRIDGLSEKFIYFNDDTFLIRPMQANDFFVDGRPVLRGRWLPAPYPRIWWNNLRALFKKAILTKKNDQSKPSYHLAQWSAARLAGFRWRYYCFNHTPYSISISTAENYFNNHLDIIKENIAYRFRSEKQFNFNALLYHLEIKSGNKCFENPSVIFMKPYKGGKNYIDRKLKESNKPSKPAFMCIQSLDISPPEDQHKVFSWLDERLSL